MLRSYIKQKFAVNRQILDAHPNLERKHDLLFEHDFDVCQKVIRKGYRIKDVIKTLASFSPAKNDTAVSELRHTLRMLSVWGV